MAIVRWDPMRDLDDFTARMQRLFDNEWPAFNKEAMTKAEWRPAVDISENNEAFFLHAELPDVKKEDIKLTVQNGYLTLTGERKFEKETKDKKFHRVERSYGSFARSFSLPTNVDEAKVQAKFENGVLNVMVPKTPPATQVGKEVKIG